MKRSDDAGSDARIDARIDAIVRGRVQGVAFRAYAQEEAIRLQLRGWVANQHDGSVHVVAEGPEETLQMLIAWLHQGSPAARVSEVKVDWSDATGEFHSFFVVR